MLAANEKSQHQSHDAMIQFTVKVHPRAKRNAITGKVGEALKLSLTSPPVDGRANEACIEYFARLFAVPRSSVTIAAGEKSRTKVVRVTGVNAAEASRLLTSVQQDK